MKSSVVFKTKYFIPPIQVTKTEKSKESLWMEYYRNEPHKNNPIISCDWPPLYSSQVRYPPSNSHILV